MAIAAQEPMMTTSDSGVLDEILWQTRNTMTLPEGFRAEIIEGAIEVSPTGALRHLKVATRLRRALDVHLSEAPDDLTGAMGTYQDGNVIHGRKVYIPDVFIAPADVEEASDPDGLGVDAAHVPFVAEVVSPGHESKERDRKRKRRAYAKAAVAVYVIIDDFDGDGVVTVLSDPDPVKGVYLAEHRVPYGTDVTIGEGPAAGFAITGRVTGG